MSQDVLVARLYRRKWLLESPLALIVQDYIDYLRAGCFLEETISNHLAVLAHFGFWANKIQLKLSEFDDTKIEKFYRHLSRCGCPQPCRRSIRGTRAALEKLLVVLRKKQSDHNTPTDISYLERELGHFLYYLQSIAGYAESTCKFRLKIVASFLKKNFGEGEIVTSKLTPNDIQEFMAEYAENWSVASVGVLKGALKSYMRFRTLQGDKTQHLMSAIPAVANWKQTKLPKVLSTDQLELFLDSFNLSTATGLRNYAIARCLADLGVRGNEIPSLMLDSIEWRDGTITISGSKGRRVKKLPLPYQTGEAISKYLSEGRPQTSCRALFVRHVAPSNEPISVYAVRRAMNLAFKKAGLHKQFCNTHALRHTFAMRLQRSGASMKEISDLLRHKSLESTAIYARVDLHSLQAVALPWPRRKP